MKLESGKSNAESRSAEGAPRNESLRAAGIRPSASPLSAFTLIELLIVIVILSLLTAAALPILTPSTTERRLREASRGLNTFIATVQAHAIGSQRPAGIGLRRLSSETGRDDARGVCLEVFAVEQPAPYAGFSEDSSVRVALNVGNTPPFGSFPFPTVGIDFVTRGPNRRSVDDLPEGWDSDLVPTGVIRRGDVIEVNGNRYEIVGAFANMALDPVTEYFGGHDGSNDRPATIVARPINNSGQLIAPVWGNAGFRVTAASISAAIAVAPYWTEPASYKILRQPVTTSAAPYALPEGVAIDLEASGVAGRIPFHFEMLTDNDQPIFILFTPEGSVERVQYQTNGGTIRITPTDRISLLIGRREAIPADTNIDLIAGSEEEQQAKKNEINWLNMESRWVNIGSQSGSVVTTENAFVDMPNLTVTDFDGNGNTPLNRRRSQILAAQEFAREMRRLGGR